MIKRIKYMVLACSVVGLGLSAVPVQASAAQNYRGESSVQILQSDFRAATKSRNYTRYAQRTQQRRISPSQAKSIALRRHPGAQFINVTLRGNTYRVRLKLNNGRIIDVSVDARAR